MTRTTKLSLLSGVAFSLAATPALAQVTGFDIADGGLYLEGGFVSDGSTPTINNSNVIPGVSYDSTNIQTGTNTFIDWFNTYVDSGVTVNADVSGYYNSTETTVTHVDLVVPANTVTDPSVIDNTGGTNVTYLDVYGSASTGTDITSVNITTDNPFAGNTVNLTQDVASIGAGGISFATYTGTATYHDFDPNNGANQHVDVTFNSTPTSGTTLDGTGLWTTGTVETPVVQNTTGSLLLQGNGPSYVQVNANDVTIHGGTSSTTVTVNDSGFNVADSTNGTTFNVDSSGNTSVAGNLSVAGGATVNGILNIPGGLQTGDTNAIQILDAQGIDMNGSTLDMDGGAITNASSVGTGTLAVTSTSTFGGTATFNGGIDMGTGTISDSSGNVTVADNLDVTGNIVGGNQAGTNTIGGANATQSNLAAGTSYVQVNQSSVLIHGGTTSTNVTVDNNGVNIASTPGGGNLQIANTGYISSSSANNGGYVTVNDDLNVTGLAVFSGSYSWTQGDNYVNGNSYLRNSIINDTGNNGGAVRVADSFNVTGATDLDSTLNVDGAATFQSNLTVAGLTTTNGIANVSGNITNTGNYTTTNGNITTTNGTITGASLVSTGNLTVAGNAAVTGNYTTTTGNITTTSGRIQAGTVTINSGGSNKIAGLANATLSATSTEAVTGQQLFATNELLRKTRKKAYQGIAMGFASNAAPLNLDNGEGGISGGVGAFEGEWGFALRAAYVSDSGVGIGANVGVSNDAVGGGVGASIKF